MKMRLFVVLAVLVALIAGCRSAPVYNVENAPVVTATGKTATEDDVRKAIIRAGASLGWEMKEMGKGEILGTLHLRNFVSVVSVNYSASSYSITYKDSTGLGYDGKNIHSNYNGWIQNLQRNINAQLTVL
jgi:hypothetical protein